jgi:anaerobic ribonucleoside-triphosphate reductase activating protein
MLDDDEVNEILSYTVKGTIRVHFTRNGITNLGPGIRYGIWVQGCNKHCEGCLAPDAQPKDGGSQRRCDEIIDEIMSSKNIKGITISGGEPVLQWKELYYIIGQVKEKKRNIGVLLYTGYSWEDDISPILKQYPGSYNKNITEFHDFWNCLNFWIDGNYQADKDDGRGLRGSSNQRLYGNITLADKTKVLCRQQKGGKWINLDTNREVSFNPIGSDPMCNFNTSLRNADIRFEQDAAYLIGIPTKKVLKDFNKLIEDAKNKHGPSADTTINQSTPEPRPEAEAEENKAEFELPQNNYDELVDRYNALFTKFQKMQKELAETQDTKIALALGNADLERKQENLSANNQCLTRQNSELETQLTEAWSANEALSSENARLQEQIRKHEEKSRQNETALNSSRREQNELVKYRKKNTDNLKFLIEFCTSLKNFAGKQSSEIEEQLALPAIQKDREKELEKLSGVWELIIAKIDDFIKQWGFTLVRPQGGDTYNPNEHHVDNPSSSTANVIKELVSAGYKTEDGIVIKPAVVWLLEKGEPPRQKGFNHETGD